jgi:protein-S-isoprenylcysteine O-methyltransferase Ste14
VTEWPAFVAWSNRIRKCWTFCLDQRGLSCAIIKVDTQPMSDTRKPVSAQILRWLQRTPVHTFVVAFELALGRGELTVTPWGAPLLAWGYLQYRLVGNYRLPRAGGTSGMDAMPEQIIATGPYRYTRNPMYLGHLIFMVGVALTFWSWFAVVLLVARATWFQQRVVHDERRLERVFGVEYSAYRACVKRWIPFAL